MGSIGPLEPPEPLKAWSKYVQHEELDKGSKYPPFWKVTMF